MPILVALILALLTLGTISMTRSGEAKAKAELTALADAGFSRLAAQMRSAEPVTATARDNLTSKAAAVARFLAHDDALLDTDALLVLCAQLDIDRVDVADAQGALIASSDASRIGLALAAQDGFAWTSGVLDDPTLQLSQADEAIPSLVYACVPRTDIEGFVLASRDDPAIRTALAVTQAGFNADDLAAGSDLLFRADTEGEDGFFYEADSLCLRKTQDGVSLIAARPVANVFAERNAMLVGFGIMALCGIILGVAIYLIRLSAGDADGADETETEADAAIAPTGPGIPRRRRGRDTPETAEDTETPRRRHDRSDAPETAEDAQEPRRRRDRDREDAPETAEDAETPREKRRRKPFTMDDVRAVLAGRTRNAEPDDSGAPVETSAEAENAAEASAAHAGPRRAGAKKRVPKGAEPPDDESAFDRIVD